MGEGPINIIFFVYTQTVSIKRTYKPLNACKKCWLKFCLSRLTESIKRHLGKTGAVLSEGPAPFPSTKLVWGVDVFFLGRGCFFFFGLRCAAQLCFGGKGARPGGQHHNCKVSLN